MGTPATPQQAMATLEEIGGVELRARMAGASLDNLRRRLEAALTAREGGDSAGVRTAAHAFKSSAAIVGARRLHDLATQVEAVPAGDEGPLLAAMTTELIDIACILEEYTR